MAIPVPSLEGHQIKHSAVSLDLTRHRVGQGAEQKR